MNNSLFRGLTVAALGAAVWLYPSPDGLDPKVWRLFAVFVSMIAGFILQPLPISAVSVICLGVAGITGVVNTTELLSGFGSPTVWLIVAAFLYAVGFSQTGLGRRTAFVFMEHMGGSALKLAYSIVLSNLMMAPATPSNTARTGGILFPVVLSLAENFGSRPGPTSRRIGAYLMMTVFQTDCITSSMFMTACASNPLVAKLAASTLGVEISWSVWALAAIVPGLIALVVLPYFLYVVYPPEIKDTSDAKLQAKKELAAMGPLSAKEKVAAGIFLMSLVLWMTGTLTGIDTTVTAIFGVGLLLATRVITWQDALEQKGGWDALIWLGATISLADTLSGYGFFKFFLENSSLLRGIAWEIVLPVLVFVFLFGHYGFAGNTPHIVAMYTMLGTLAVAAGAPAPLAALSLAFTTIVSSGATHYGNGPAVIYFGAGYIEQGVWWKLGLIVSLLNLAMMVGLGAIWWKIIGLW